MNWGRLNRALHRDLGYFFAGLTLLYAISGIALNHAGDFNPSYNVEKETIRAAVIPQEGNEETILSAVGAKGPVKTVFRPAPGKIQIITEGENIAADTVTGEISVERIRERPLIFPLNYLHLNHPKGAWTYAADIYALALAFLAASGLFLVKGKNGLMGRAMVLTGAGMLLPVVFYLIYH